MPTSLARYGKDKIKMGAQSESKSCDIVKWLIILPSFNHAEGFVAVLSDNFAGGRAESFSTYSARNDAPHDYFNDIFTK